jgi:4-amino-4-deoxy-L-arabinose transferase-like glycosyltransferase
MLPKYIHFFFGLLTAWLIYRYLLLRLGRLAGFLGALLWLSIPIVVRLSSEVYVDLGLSAFSMAMLFAIIRWSESDSNRHSLVIAGICCGLAMGTKYNGLLMLAVSSLMVPLIYIRVKPVQSISTQTAKSRIADPVTVSGGQWINLTSLRAFLCSAAFVCVALVVFSPWAIRNTIFKGNPVYPMLNQVFNPDKSDSEADWSHASTMVQNTSNTIMIRRLVFKESFGDIALLPLRIFFQGKDDDPRHFDGVLNPFLPLFIASAIGFWRFNPGRLSSERWIWFNYSALFIMLAFFLAPIRIRYLAPVLPALTVLTVIGIYNLKAWLQAVAHPLFRHAGEIILAISIFAMFAFNGTYFMQRFQETEPWAYLNGKISREDYINKRRPEYPLIQYINKNTPQDARILAIFMGERRYYFDRDVTFNEGLLLHAIKKAVNSDEIDSFLKDSDITSILVRMEIFQKWLVNNLTADEIKRFKAFWKAHARKIAARGTYALFAMH